jgi:hypothetical protein
MGLESNDRWRTLHFYPLLCVCVCVCVSHSNVLLYYYEHFFYTLLENVNKSRTSAGRPSLNKAFSRVSIHA